MVEARFSFGEEGKHELWIFYSLWTGRLKVEIDGKRVTDSRFIGLTKACNYEIGDAEPHEVAVKLSSVFVPSVEASVDGKILGNV